MSDLHPLQTRPKKVLIYDELAPDITERLAALGLAVTYEPNISKEAIRLLLPDYHIIIGRSKLPLSAEVLSLGKQLEVVCRAGAGLEDIDLTYCEKAGITVINAPEGNRDAVGEHALGLMLAIMHKIAISWDEVRHYQWRREANRSTELMGKTVGIIGFGNNGQALGKRLQGFGVRVLACDPYLSYWPENMPWVQPATLDEVLASSHIVSLHVPLNEETHQLINAEKINRAGNPFYLINVSRGPVVDAAAVLTHLDDGKLLGAALDVLPYENPQNFPENFKLIYEKLITHPRVILTPHIAGLSQESYLRVNEILTEKIRKHLNQSS